MASFVILFYSPPMGTGWRAPRALLIFLVLIGALAAPAAAHNVYLSNENHTDYGWNATVPQYEASMLSELDYYLGRIAATAGNPPAEQARFNADCWLYMWLYEHNRSAAQFQQLIDAIVSGHISVPLNPLVTLYGALPTEAAIRAGYYPGRMERAHGIDFAMAENMENHTTPWGLSSLWAGSAVKYSWKGVCGCITTAPYNDHTTDVFRWQGPDGKELLMKWYQFGGNNQSWGGYAEARVNLTTSAIQGAIDHFSARGQTLTGLFGYGWDDVSSQTDAIVTAVQAWNAAHPGGDRAQVSNNVDYFQELEASRGSLPVLRGGWGNDWDLWPATLAQRTAALRRAVEQLRTAEALAAVVHGKADPSFWPARHPTLESAWLDHHRYFEHTWSDGGVGNAYIVGNKKTWQQSFTGAVDQFDQDATAAFAALFQTPAEQRFTVFNPLSVSRTDAADLKVAGGGPYVVVDVATATEVPNQLVTKPDGTYLRILASNVPALGYRVYRYAAGTPAVQPDCCTVTPASRRVENPLYRIDLGTRGDISSAVHKATGLQMAGTGLNDFGAGSLGSTIAQDVGPVSATVVENITGTPPRRVRVTLFKDVDRVEIENEILANTTATSHYRFNVALTQPQIRFEEIGAIARPGFAAQGGDFLPGTRADYMTLNHFVDFADALGGFHITLSSRDAYAMKVGNSTATTFDLPSSEIRALALGNVSSSSFNDQGANTSFRDDFALSGSAGTFSGAQAMAMGLMHQNPLRALPLPANQSGPLTAPTANILSIDAPNVLLTAVKPAEEGDRGIVVRLWELDGTATNFALDASAFAPTAAYETSLIETDVAPATMVNGVIMDSIGANEIKTYRFLPSGLPLTPTATASASATATAPPTSTATRTLTPSRTPTLTATPTLSLTPTRSATSTPTQSPTRTATLTATATATRTATFTPTPTMTHTPTRTATSTPTQSPTRTATLTASSTVTLTPTQTATCTATATGTVTATPTLTATATSSPTETPTDTATALPTETPTDTPTLTATAVPTGLSVTGRLRYYSNQAPVADAQVQLLGDVPTTAPSTADGQFVLAPIDGGTWQIEPLKQSDDGAVSALDASLVLQAAVGLVALTPEQQLACDVTGNGTLSALDASYILRRRVDLIAHLPVADECGSDWLFVPAPSGVGRPIPPQIQPGSCRRGAIAYEPLAASATGQDFTAILLGDCTGNWQPASAGAALQLPAALPTITLGRVRRDRRGRVWLPLRVAAPAPIYAFEAVLHYDARRLRMLGVRRLRGARTAAMALNHTRAGTIKIAVARAMPIVSRGRAVVAVLFAPANRHRAPDVRVTVEAPRIEP